MKHFQRRPSIWSRIFAVSLLLSLSAFSWAQESPSSSTDSPPAASAPNSPAPAPTWDQLDQILTQLEQAATDSQANSQQLKGSLSQARNQLMQLSQALANSQTQVTALSSSLAQSAASLKASAQSLASAEAEARRRSTESALWRAGTLAGVAGVGGALAITPAARGAGLGIAVGSAAGALWFLFDILTQHTLP